MATEQDPFPMCLYVDITFRAPLGKVAAGALCTGGMPGRATQNPREVSCERCLARMKNDAPLMERLAERYESQVQKWKDLAEGAEPGDYDGAVTEAQTLAANMRRFLEESQTITGSAGA